MLFLKRSWDRCDFQSDSRKNSVDRLSDGSL
jgi:hypothetical protein